MSALIFSINADVSLNTAARAALFAGIAGLALPPSEAQCTALLGAMHAAQPATTITAVAPGAGYLLACDPAGGITRRDA
jgi:hypothetical protein